MNRLLPALLFLLPFIAFSSPIMAQAGQGPEEALLPMPPERAQATFEDARVKTFLSVVEKDFGGTCSIPDFTKAEAKRTQHGSGDFSSTFYEMSLPCPGNNGLNSVQITVEFSPPLGKPLNLVLALQYKR